MLQNSEYEKIIKFGDKVDWYGSEVPESLLTPQVRVTTEQIIEQINKFEGVDRTKKNVYIEILWLKIKNLPYTLNGDVYLKKKKKFELEKENLKVIKTKSNKNVIKERKPRVTKNSGLIFGNKKK